MALVPLLVLSYLAIVSSTKGNLTTTGFTTANTPLLGSYPVPTTASTPLLGSYPVPTTASTLLLGSYPVPTTASTLLLGSYPVPTTASTPLLGSYPVPTTANTPLLGSYPVPTTANTPLLGSYPVPTTANTPLLGSYPVPTTASTPLLGSYPVHIVVAADDYEGLSRHTSVPQEESLETSSTLTLTTELKVRPFNIAATPHLTVTDAFHTEISVVSRETSAKINLFLTELAAVSTDIGANLLNIGAVSTKIDAFTAEIDVIPTETSVILTETSVIPTEISVIPTETSVIPTETSVIPTETSVIPTETSVIPTEISVIPTETSVIPTETSVIPTETSVIPTETSVIPTETSVIPTETSVIPTETSGIPTESSVIPTETSVIPTETSVIPTETSVILTEINVIPTGTNVPSTEISVIPTEMSVVSSEKGAFMSLFSTKRPSVPPELNSFLTEMTGFSLFTTKTIFNSIAPPEMSPVSTVNATVTTSQLSNITTPSLATLPPLVEEPEPPYFFCSDYRPQSCSAKCGEVSQVGCSCDERCLVYNSCCYDYEDVCKMEANTARIKHQKLLNLEFTCQKVLYQDTSGSQVISSCPSNNSTDQLTKQQCEIDEAESFLRPVTSKILKFHFKNIYCMLCNGGELSDALFWTNVAGFDKRRLLAYVYDDGHRFHKVIQTQKLFVPPVIKDVPLRNCFVSTTSSCPKNSSQHLTKLCSESKADLVSLKQDRYHRLFKNIHCLNCSLQAEMFDQSCKHTEVLDVVYTRAPIFQFLLDWKSRSLFIVTHKSPLNWDEMECLVDEYGRLQQACQITKCKGNIILKNNTCSLKNVISCFLFTFQLHVNVSEQVNDMESVNRTLEIFKPKLSDTIYDAYSKIILIQSLEFGVSSISLNSELGQLSTGIWIKLYGVSTASFKKFGFNTEHFKFLNSSMADVRLDFYLCACQAIKYIFGVCTSSTHKNDYGEFCVGSRSDGTDNVNNSSMFLILCMFFFNYLKVY